MVNHELAVNEVPISDIGYRMLDFGSIIFYILQKAKVFYFISEIRNPQSAIVRIPSDCILTTSNNFRAFLKHK